MSPIPKHCTATVIPGLRYQDAPAAIEWLCRVLGFHKQAVYSNSDGTVAHAQLTFGNGMIMLGSVAERHAGLWKQPGEVGMANTQSAYLVVNDPDAVYANVRAAQAEIVHDIVDQSYGGRGFSCRDPEGHIWSIGNYDPWEPEGA